jgi:hypothetical protein
VPAFPSACQPGALSVRPLTFNLTCESRSLPSESMAFRHLFWSGPLVCDVFLGTPCSELRLQGREGALFTSVAATLGRGLDPEGWREWHHGCLSMLGTQTP